MGAADPLTSEVTLTNGKTVRITTERPTEYYDGPFRVYIETPSDEATVVLDGLTPLDMEALVHRAVVRAIIKEDRN